MVCFFLIIVVIINSQFNFNNTIFIYFQYVSAEPFNTIVQSGERVVYFKIPF